jgi:UDP-glucose 4-epimerase
MKCVVTGATGFIGSALRRSLEAGGNELVCSGREAVTGPALASVDTVFHCAGVAHQSASAAAHEQANFRAVLVQARAARDAGARQFVFFSSVKAAPQGNPYSVWKWRAEQSLGDEFSPADMRIVILRPALVYGPAVKGNLRSLMRVVRLGLPVPPVSQPRSLVGLDDLCAACGKLLDCEFEDDLVFTLTDGQSYDLARIHAAIRQGLGRPVGGNWTPAWLWRIAALGRYQKLFAGELYDNQVARELLDWQPAQTLEQAMPLMLAELD